jgi:hypothetical protein
MELRRLAEICHRRLLALKSIWFSVLAVMAQPSRDSVVPGPGRFSWTDTFQRCHNLASILPAMEDVPPEPPPSAAPPAPPSMPTRNSHRDLPIMTTSTLPPIRAPPSTTTAVTSTSRMASNSSDVAQQHVMRTMNLLAWNCQGSGGSLVSSMMNHLHRLLTSTKAKVTFVSETRNSKFSKTDLINRFNVYYALIVSPQGMSSGLWLMWDQDTEVTVESSSNNLILASCIYKPSSYKFGLVCMYGDPITKILFHMVQCPNFRS